MVNGVSKFMDKEDNNKKKNLYKAMQIILCIASIIFLTLFVNELFIQPFRSKKAMNKIQDLYQNPALIISPKPEKTSYIAEETSPILEATRPSPTLNKGSDRSSDETLTSDEIDIHENSLQESSNKSPDIATEVDTLGRLIEFQELLKINEDIKGWISIEGTYINYPVLQSSTDDPEYYLYRNFFKENDKAGSIFLDIKSSVEDNSKHLILHGHNMHTTDSMFHALMEYKKSSFYHDHPIIKFDTIYEKAQWKIFSIFVTNGTSLWEPLFDYTRTDFENDSDFMNFVYQLRLRSLYNIDSVDVNEKDQLLTLSTCSYELNNYRTVIVARKIREGEEITVDLDTVTINPNPLYPKSWYDYYGGKAPSFTSFEEALENGEINWYSGN